MNQEILYRLAKGEGLDLYDALRGLKLFIREHCGNTKPSAVGFNVGSFDIAFLKSAQEPNIFHHRSVELGSLLATPDRVPVRSSDIIKEARGTEVVHDALADAQDAVRMYRYWRKNWKK
jgi:oligoribonuclease (3'-5' exoribonuclease)